jgi:hypothetical protein
MSWLYRSRIPGTEQANRCSFASNASSFSGDLLWAILRPGGFHINPSCEQSLAASAEAIVTPGRFSSCTIIFDRPTARQEITGQRKRILARLKRSVAWGLRDLGASAGRMPRNLCSSASQLSLDRSAWQSHNSGLFKDRETHRDTQLKCSPQSRRQPYGASSSVLDLLRAGC